MMMTANVGREQMGTNAVFWHEVADIEKSLIDKHQVNVKLFKETRDNDAFEGQPGDGSGLFIMSLKNRARNTTAGAVICVNYHLAAQKLNEETHRLATHDEIRAFNKSREDSVVAIRFEEDRKAGRIQPTPQINVSIGGKKQNATQTTETTD